MMMLQAFVQVVLVALGLCKQHTILNRMVKAAQLKLGGFLYIENPRIVGYRTKSVAVNADGAS